MFMHYDCCKNKKKELEYSVSSKGASETESFGWHLFCIRSEPCKIQKKKATYACIQELVYFEFYVADTPHRENEVFERALHQSKKKFKFLRIIFK